MKTGSISGWEAESNFKYQMKTLWELQRFSKQNKKTSASILSILTAPFTLGRIAMLASDGTLWMWNYKQNPAKNWFSIVGILEGLTSPISCLSLRQFYKGQGAFVTSPITAIGSATGTLQILNLRTNVTEVEFLVSKQRLRAVRWLNHIDLHLRRDGRR